MILVLMTLIKDSVVCCAICCKRLCLSNEIRKESEYSPAGQFRRKHWKQQKSFPTHKPEAKSLEKATLFKVHRRTSFKFVLQNIIKRIQP